MSEAKHTPGPWKVVHGNAIRDFNEFSIRPEKSPIRGVQLPIAKVARYGDFEFGEANARLIAAAPDLLDALQAVLANCMDSKGLADAYKQARAAIAKATGEQA